MDKKDIFKMAKNPKFIPGIYNYCDRWCERCPFTSRCMVYAMEQEDVDDPAARDINNEAFWEKMQSVFQQTLEMISDMAQEQGIELESLEVEAEMEEENRRREEAENHELSQAARTYSKMVDQWFESEREVFEQKEDELNTKLNLGIEEAELNDEAKSIMEAVEVIHWYQHQIYVKLMRGLMGDDFDEIETEPDTQNDSNGSVKVALIGMDRSISAWGKLQNHFPEKTDEILTILLHLDRLRRKTEEVFPDARNFIRPGFDTVVKAVK
jgi:O6-methylguanine-DNA--protein-cysteine methyltransferase